METYKEECESKSLTINKLQKRIGELESILSAKDREIRLCIKEKNAAVDALSPTKNSLNRVTAELSKLKRKTKRQENSK